MLLAADVSGDTDTQLLQPVAVEVALDSDVASGSVAGDVNGDGLLQPIDVLLIINAVNADGEMTLMAGDPMDVNVDGWLTLDDASLAMAHLAAAMSTPSESPQPTVEPQAYDYDSSDTVDPFAASASSSMEPDTEPSASTSFSFVPSPSFEPTPSPSDQSTPSPSDEPTPSPSDLPIPSPSDEPTPSPTVSVPCPSCSPPADGETEAISWNSTIGLSASLDKAISKLKAKLGTGLLTTQPFAGVPDDFQLPIILPFVGITWTPSIPIPGASIVRGWTIEDLIDFYLQPYIFVVSGADYSMGVEVIAHRDPIVLGCGCNMDDPEVSRVGPPVSLSGNFTFNVGTYLEKVKFEDTHRYPRKDSNGNPRNNPFYDGDDGNLVDEKANVAIGIEVTFGINMTIPFTGTQINEDVKFEMDPFSIPLKCSGGTPLPIVSPDPPGPLAP